ncbi:hypothetical protein [Amycolatopsis jejuensis]|uniref:hypothetical protein n=1 Tax=Amycolatopsis jejuensis TaxID=330084 RepID=UPI000B2903FA|nr:hypothetical protein [Amycolatopsis jejuensis]
MGNTRDEAVLHLGTAVATRLLGGILEGFGSRGPVIEVTYRRVCPDAPDERLATAHRR